MDKNEGKIDKSLKALMACEIINAVIDLFLGTFLVAYLLNITNDNMGAIAIYYVVDYAITGIFIYVIAGFLKKYNIEKIYRAGILIKCIFVISIVFLREQIQSFLIPIAIILGISETIYWGACDNIVGLATNEKNREKYTANKKIIRSFVKVIMPIILGTSIELLSFYKVSTYIMVLAFIQFILSFFIKIQKRYSGEFDLKAFLKSINLKENKRLKIVYKSSILYGVLMNVISTIVTIIIVMTYKTNIELGFLSTIFSICSMITLYVFKKVKNEKIQKSILTCGSIIALVSVISLIINLGKTEIVIYNIISSSFIIILEVLFNIERYNNKENSVDEEYCIENQTFIIMIMQIGRIVGYGLLFIISLINNIVYFKLLLLLTTIVIPIYSYYMYKLHYRE
ncbi:MAG: MFS transporter [Clostridia bacterium]|nr:MFS transporter [Clostridia bacterium]